MIQISAVLLYKHVMLSYGIRLREGCVAGRLWFSSGANRYRTYPLILLRKQLQKYHFLENCLIAVRQNNWARKGNIEERCEKIRDLVWQWDLLTVLQISE